MGEERKKDTMEDKCLYCDEEIFPEFFPYEKVVLITIEREEDGAKDVTKFWAHEKCLPDNLAK